MVQIEMTREEIEMLREILRKQLSEIIMETAFTLPDADLDNLEGLLLCFGTSRIWGLLGGLIEKWALNTGLCLEGALSEYAN